MRSLVGLLVMLIFGMSSAFTSAQAIRLNDWQIHNTMHNSLSATTDGAGRVWVASQGGIAIYSDYADTLPQMLTANTLLSPSIAVLKHIPNTSIMIAGSVSGVIEFIDDESFAITHYTAIRDYNFTDPSINDIYLWNGKALIAGNFGIAEFDLQKNIFTNTIQTIGDFPRNTPVNNIEIDGNTIYVATPLGIAKASLTSSINVPSNWTTYLYKTDDGYTISEATAKIVLLNGRLFVNLVSAIYELDGSNLVKYMNKPNSYEILDIVIYRDKLCLILPFQVLYMNNISDTTSFTFIHTQWETTINGFVDIHNSIADFVVLYKQLGCAFVKDDYTFKLKVPNTPVGDAFMNFCLDNNGVLYATPDNSQDNRTGSSVMRFDGSQWKNYTTTLSDFPSDASFKSVVISPDNRVFASSWGDGLYIIDERSEPPIYTHYNHTNSPVWGVNTDGTYEVVGQCCFDSKGRAWFPTYGSSRNQLVALNADGSFVEYSNIAVAGISGYNLTIDANNTKWLCAQKYGSFGIYYFNERNTLEDKSDDVSGNINTGRYPNLMANYYYCCKYDPYINVVLIGTPAGLAIINNPNAAIGNGNLLITKNKLLDGQVINDIFIDATGKKWIATNNGIWVLSVDCSELIAQFTTDNTPLYDNEVQAITISPKDGTVYIGTRRGLFIANGTEMMPQASYSITTYPQPFDLRKHTEIVIDGLTADSEIRIVTADGLLVRNLRTDSKKAVWDGKDNSGNKVNVGVYVVLSNSVVANASGAGKIVVVE
ncbi:MAG: hypothetical protein LBO69_03120 [Ignavibacteria bacterium]|jgi:hypothetical protein|nr:hypothetical protein [Ignavibacteria bacterium]